MSSLTLLQLTKFWILNLASWVLDQCNLLLFHVTSSSLSVEREKDKNMERKMEGNMEREMQRKMERKMDGVDDQTAGG